MSHGPAPLQSVAWRELFPWVILLRSWKTALSPSLLALAAAAILLTQLGWRLAGLPTEQSLPFLIGFLEPVLARFDVSAAPLNDLAAPLLRMTDPIAPAASVVCNLAGWLLAVAVWSWVGGVIARWTVVAHGAGQSTDVVEAGWFVARRYGQFFLAPVAPWAALAVLVALLVPVGWLLRFDAGVWLAAPLWLGVLALGLVGAWLWVGLLFGWPLMWGVLAAQKEGDCLQAFSDSYSYVFGRPLHYVGYTLVSLLVLSLAGSLVDYVAERAVQIGHLGVTWGAGTGRFQELFPGEFNRYRFGVSGPPHAADSVGATLLGGLIQAPRLVAQAYRAVLFFVLATTIFLLLRRDCDEKQLDAVYLEMDEPPPTPESSKPATDSGNTAE